ncbi:MAG: DNA sulfur modification protein DndB [Polyangiales bacterium]
MIPKGLKKQSALDLTIKGSMGDFSVSQGEVSSVRVNYLLSHVGLGLEGDHEERLISRLAPFREVYDTKELDFDQIMQRDIDDARVSAELIPYLLEQSTTGLVKLFPPIIVVLLPTEANGKPAAHYPKVETSTAEEHGEEFESVRSGALGHEVFELRRWLRDGEPQAHDFAELRINTNRCKLVIVDGQHRAMSLLALYRNIKGWPDRTRSVEPYYKIWTASRLAKFDLTRVTLPIMFCVFPQLDGGQYGADVEVHKACRSIFLALNKNARPVTRSRNILLDDRDVVAAFLRAILGYIKGCDISSSEAIRLSAVELDNENDRTKLTSPVAVTNVTHLNGLLERLMLAQPPQPGLTVRAQNLWLATRLDKCFERLGLQDDLTPEVEKNARRNNCDPKITARLEAAFRKVYLPVLVRGLDAFGPYRAHHDVAARLREKLDTGANSDFYRAILFEGEGMNRVFSEFQERLAELKDDDNFASPELNAISDEFRKRQGTLKGEVDGFFDARASKLLEGVPRELATNEGVKAWVNRVLYGESLTTAAFQNALFLTFFGVIEQINSDRSKPPAQGAPLLNAEVRELFEGYLEDLNAFFVPRKREGLARLAAVFYGELREDNALVSDSYNLKRILLSGELKPDEWPRFRAMLQELWRPSHAEAARLLDEHRALVRAKALDGFIDREVKDLCRQKAIREVDLPREEREALEARCAAQLAKGLKALGASVRAEDLLDRARETTPDQPEE